MMKGAPDYLLQSKFAENQPLSGAGCAVPFMASRRAGPFDPYSLAEWTAAPLGTWDILGVTPRQ